MHNEDIYEYIIIYILYMLMWLRLLYAYIHLLMDGYLYT